jgi:hypothetical protein
MDESGRDAYRSGIEEWDADENHPLFFSRHFLGFSTLYIAAQDSHQIHN